MDADKIKSSITTSYMFFILDFGDPYSLNKESLEKQIGPLSEIFLNQKRADSAKKTLGKDGFDKMLSLYFSQFQNQDGLDYNSLEDALLKSKKTFLRHLGKDKINYLNLLIKIAKDLKGHNTKGLLFEEAS